MRKPLRPGGNALYAPGPVGGNQLARLEHETGPGITCCRTNNKWNK